MISKRLADMFSMAIHKIIRQILENIDRLYIENNKILH